MTAPSPPGPGDTDLTAFTDDLIDRAHTALATADVALATAFPGAAPRRQPVHTFYWSAARFTGATVAEMGRQALEALDRDLPDAAALADALGGVQRGDGLGPLLDPELAEEIYPLIRAKLETEPIEDLRIDFEDGFTQRGVAEADRDADESRHLDRVLTELDEATMPPFWGLRFKSLDPSSRVRGITTFVGFVDTWVRRYGRLPRQFHPTLPKVTSVAQVEQMVTICERLERRLELAPSTLRFEIQIETPQSIIGPDGTTLVARFVHAAQGRCLALHYGTYDYSAYCNIAPQYQSMEHPVADFAKANMQAAAAGTGVWLSDGSTNILPTGSLPERLAGWRLHARLVDRSLRQGFYQGWDLHPAQLITRYAATYAFYRRGAATAIERLQTYRALALGEHVESPYLDEPATAKMLAGFVLRGKHCGALTEADTRATGLDTAGLAHLVATGTLPTTDPDPGSPRIPGSPAGTAPKGS